jgi:quinol-cytochrome oxidoreductase complex cytochrome b subunit
MSRDKSGILDWFSRRLNLTEIFSLLTSYGLFYAELDTRKPLREALDEALERPVVSYGRWPRVLGLIVVVLIALEILTGALLGLYFLPTPQTAHASLGTILRDVDFGWFVHQIHFWGAQLLIAVLIVRILRFFIQGVYRPPRELMWVFAALLLLVCFHLDLTGRALPMTETAYWSSVRALEVVNAVPVYGSLMFFLAGGGEMFVSELTLLRFYILHAAILPVLAVTLIYLHFSTIRRIGLTEASGDTKRVGKAALRNHLVNLAIILTLLFALLVTLAVLTPLPFQREADPYATVPGVGPPWYLLAPFGFLEITTGIVPQWLAGLVLFLVFSAFLALPFLERSKADRGRRWAVPTIAVLVVLAWILLTIYGARVA